VTPSRSSKSRTLEDWISERVRKLTCTANDMIPLAQACNFKEKSKWKEERDQLRAELDAAYFHLYALSRPDVEFILTTFQAIANQDAAQNGQGKTRRQILDFYDDYASKMK